MGARGRFLWLVVVLCAAPGAAQGQQEPAAVLDVTFTPTPRAQIAIWIEDSYGRFLATVGLTESVAFRGIGNRPGASQMNSGYRWPYGRREGVLPTWGRRRALSYGARQFRRVVFQDRTSEGHASRSSNDYSLDTYYCLSFRTETTRRDALDAVSCASVFSSDKGRFLNPEDVEGGYAEPWTSLDDADAGEMMAMPLNSLYPPRMDAFPCVVGNCFDHEDIVQFAAHARAVMPEIDTVTMATPPGGVPQSVLFTVPPDWPGGDYRLMVEVHTEGDYNGTFNAESHPTPTQPEGGWDTYALGYGYPYRGQPSVVYEVPFVLGAEGEVATRSDAPVGRSSWRRWDDNYGVLQSLEGITDDPNGAEGSGADRLKRGADGHRVMLAVRTLGGFVPPADGEDPWDHIPLPDPDSLFDPLSQPPLEPEEWASPVVDPRGGDDAGDPTIGTPSDQAGGDGEQGEAGDDGAAGREDAPSRVEREQDGEAVILTAGDATRFVDAVRGLQVEHHHNRLRAHQWVSVRFLAVESREALHSYEVRVSTQPITDAASFIREGRPAKTATDDAEGAVSLMLPVEIPAGEPVEGEIGDLVAATHYWIAVRGKDVLDRKGPVSVVEITTEERVFATVSACFVATAAYGTPLAADVGVLRRFRDRYLLAHGPGRWLVQRYYSYGPGMAAIIRDRPLLRRVARLLLAPLVVAVRGLQ